MSIKTNEVVAQLGCNPRVSNRVMDPEFAAVIAEKIDVERGVVAFTIPNPKMKPLIQRVPTPDPEMVKASRAAYARGDFQTTEELLMEREGLGPEDMERDL